MGKINQKAGNHAVFYADDGVYFDPSTPAEELEARPPFLKRLKNYMMAIYECATYRTWKAYPKPDRKEYIREARKTMPRKKNLSFVGKLDESCYIDNVGYANYRKAVLRYECLAKLHRLGLKAKRKRTRKELFRFK